MTKILGIAILGLLVSAAAQAEIQPSATGKAAEDLYLRIKASGVREVYQGNRFEISDELAKCTEYLKPNTTDTDRYECSDL
jgi:hypothetical protein